MFDIGWDGWLVWLGWLIGWLIWLGWLVWLVWLVGLVALVGLVSVGFGAKADWAASITLTMMEYEAGAALALVFRCHHRSFYG